MTGKELLKALARFDEEVKTRRQVFLDHLLYESRSEIFIQCGRCKHTERIEEFEKKQAITNVPPVKE